MNIRQTLALAALAITLAPLACPTEPQWKVKEDLARELVATMKVDEQAAQKVENQILARCRVKKCDADLRQCLMKFDREDITMGIESAAEQALTADELKQAIAYFRGEAGQKHLDILRAEQGLGGEDTLFNQPPEIRDRMLAFLGTRAGYLIVTRGVLTEESNQWTARLAEAAFWDCKPQP